MGGCYFVTSSVPTFVPVTSRRKLSLRGGGWGAHFPLTPFDTDLDIVDCIVDIIMVLI